MKSITPSRLKKYRSQFVSITGLTVVMLFGFQNCAKVTAEVSSAASSVAVNTKGLSLSSSEITLGGATIPLQGVSVQDSSDVQTQIVCEVAGMYVDPVQGKCPEGAQQIGGDTGSSTVSFSLPDQDVELAINALDSRTVDLGECVTDVMPQMLAKNPKLKILLYVAPNDSMDMYSIINAWMGSRINNLKDTQGVLLSAEVRKDIISRYRVVVRSSGMEDFNQVVDTFILEKFFVLPANQVLKVSSQVRFGKDASVSRCEGGDSIRPKLQLRLRFQGLAQNLKVHLQKQDQSMVLLQKFSVQVNPSSADPDDKILSMDLEDLVGISRITLEYVP